MRSRKFLHAEQVPLVWDTPGLIAGVDEAGRGPLAGPVVAAAVILDDLHPIRGLADSKKLTARRREQLYDEIRAKALCCSVAQASVEEIDRLNILQATMLAMKRAVQGLRLKPVKVLVDGNRLPTLDVLAEAIVKGDALVPAISAASILAKVTRDRWCIDYDLQFPQYGFAGHKGYGTAVHMAALQAHGPCPEHRRSFAPVSLLAPSFPAMKASESTTPSFPAMKASESTTPSFPAMKASESTTPSFPRKRESSAAPALDSRFRGNDGGKSDSESKGAKSS